MKVHKVQEKADDAAQRKVVQQAARDAKRAQEQQAKEAKAVQDRKKEDAAKKACVKVERASITAWKREMISQKKAGAASVQAVHQVSPTGTAAHEMDLDQQNLRGGKRMTPLGPNDRDPKRKKGI